MEEWPITRAKTDKDAFMKLYEIYYPKLFAFFLVRTRNKELSEDIAQETFAKAIPALKNFQYKGRSFGSWLFKIAQNELISSWRKGRRKDTIPGHGVINHTTRSSASRAEAARVFWGYYAMAIRIRQPALSNI